MDSHNVGNLLLLAEVLYQERNFSGAATQIKCLLELDGQGSNADALILLVEALRRLATLDEARPFLDEAEKVAGWTDPGIRYCRGLYYRYANDPNNSLKEFNCSRKDALWKERSIYQMIEIFCTNQ